MRKGVGYCIIASLVLGMPAGAQNRSAGTLTSTAYLEDFDEAWAFVRNNYAYFDRKKTDWERVREIYRPLAARVANRREFVGVLERVLEELYDPHAHLGANTASSPRLVPSGSDLWAEWRGERAIITDVRTGSQADRAGVRSGMEIISVGGRTIRDAVRDKLPRAMTGSDSAACDWALRAVLAGRRDTTVTIAVKAGRGTATFEFRPGEATDRVGPLDVGVLPGNVGYARVRNALGDIAMIAAWDSALVALRETDALVLDLRDTPSGGNSTVARAILSRLVSEERPYQRHDLPAEERLYGVRRIWVEYVAPRGPFTYRRPMVVLVGRWTGSMGEGLAIGLDGMQRATIIGTPMAGLRGATYGKTLRNTEIEVRIPVERLFHVRGTPREDFVPPVVVRRGSENAGIDRSLAAALELLRR